MLREVCLEVKKNNLLSRNPISKELEKVITTIAVLFLIPQWHNLNNHLPFILVSKVQKELILNNLKKFRK